MSEGKDRNELWTEYLTVHPSLDSKTLIPRMAENMYIYYKMKKMKCARS